MELKNKNSVPHTLALIPDGNRRWARRHRLSVLNGYSLGVKKFIDFSEWCMDYGIDSITVWALSSDNLKRPSKEVKALFNVYMRLAKDKEILARLHKTKTRLKLIYNPKFVPRELLRALQKMEFETRIYSDRVINMLLGYGGKDDLLHAVAQYAKYRERNRGVPEEELFERYLMSQNIPNLDFIIRTSGEQRLSGFMPWQSSYSELYFSKKLWPDFTRRDLKLALTDYSARQRRFGK